MKIEMAGPRQFYNTMMAAQQVLDQVLSGDQVTQ